MRAAEAPGPSPSLGAHHPSFLIQVRAAEASAAAELGAERREVARLSAEVARLEAARADVQEGFSQASSCYSELRANAKVDARGMHAPQSACLRKARRIAISIRGRNRFKVITDCDAGKVSRSQICSVLKRLVLQRPQAQAMRMGRR